MLAGGFGPKVLDDDEEEEEEDDKEEEEQEDDGDVKEEEEEEEEDDGHFQVFAKKGLLLEKPPASFRVACPILRQDL